ncbi:MAG: FecR domain-containing protein [Rhodospirillales bacterium]|nr:FecR domain-containing protein [Rhodospirillales bacterium]
MSLHRGGAVLLLAIGCAATAAPASAVDDIGVASTVVNKVEGSVGGRTLRLGDKVHVDERISTGPASRSQLLFRDETVLTVGEASNVTLDRFVYDPARGAPSVTLSMTRGALRFVSGNLPSQAYVIRTPAGAIGVRGTIFDLVVEEDGTTMLHLVEGAVDFRPRAAGAGATRLDRRGASGLFGPDGKMLKLFDGLRLQDQRRLNAIRDQAALGGAIEDDPADLRRRRRIVPRPPQTSP